MNKFVAKYGRILVPLITPYGENEEVDYVQYEKLIDYIITNKLGDSLIVTGTTGEASLLTFDERVKLMETAINAAADTESRGTWNRNLSCSSSIL